MSFEDSVLFYLTMVLYPPVSKLYVKTAISAILLAREGKYNEEVKMPGGKHAKVKNVIDWLLLHNFVVSSSSYKYMGSVPAHIESTDLPGPFKKFVKSVMLLLLTIGKKGKEKGTPGSDTPSFYEAEQK
jgi:hypothetical protein